MTDANKEAGKNRRRRTVDEIDAEIARLKEQRREVRTRSADRFARIALETGLADLKVSDEEIEVLFRDAAGRFRGSGANGVRDPHPEAPATGSAADADARP